MVDTQIYLTIWSLPLSNIKRHSETLLVQWLTNRSDFKPLYEIDTELTFTYLLEFFLEH